LTAVNLKVKLGTDESSGLGLVGGADSTSSIIEAKGPESSIRLSNRDGGRQAMRP
jgi:hypothetical protein